MEIIRKNNRKLLLGTQLGIALFTIMLPLIPNILVLEKTNPRLLIVIQLISFVLFYASLCWEKRNRSSRFFLNNKNEILKSFLIFLLIAIISSLLSQYKFNAVYRLSIVYFNIIVITYMISSFDELDKVISLFLIILLLIGLLSAIYGILLTRYGTPDTYNSMYVMKVDFFNIEFYQRIIGRRPSSVYTNPNFYGLVLALGISASLPFIKIKNLYYTLPIVFIQFYGLIQTQSRSALITVFIISALLMVYKLRHNKRLLFVLLSISVVFSMALYKIIVTRRGNAESGRSYIWRQSLNTFITKPLLGYGFGMSIEAINIEGGLSTHNVYLKLLVETGVLGLIGFLNIYYELLKESIKSNYLFKKKFVLLSLSILITFLVHQFFESSLFVYNYIMSIWITLVAYIWVEIERGKYE